VPNKDNLIFTFNRDEHPLRNNIEAIEVKRINKKKIYYPKDQKHGGTWFVVDNKGNLALLFNGAFVKHIKKPIYEKSRGVLLLELFEYDNFLEAFSKCNLNEIEPFSVIAFFQNQLQRLTWDGEVKNCSNLNIQDQYIFSSATIYDTQIQHKRKNWLKEYLENKAGNENNLMEFHQNYNSEDLINGLVINRSENLKTISTTQAIIGIQNTELKHSNILDNKKNEIYLDIWHS
jgi:uncharacterized protein with NRDE domain